MKILFLVPVVPPVINGIGEYTLHLVRGLRDAGADAHIITSEGQARLEPWIHPVITEWNAESIAERIAPLTPDWISLQYVPQLYHPKGLCWKVSGIPAGLKRKLKCRTSVTFHEFICGAKGSLKNSILAFMLNLQTKRLLSGCDFAVTTCESYREMLSRFSKTPVHMIPVGANILPHPFSGEVLASKKNLLPKGPTAVFSVFGRLSTFRDHTLALNILDRARNEGISASLILIGCMRSSSPEIFKHLMKEAQRKNLTDQILETGEISAEEASLFLTLSDVFLFPQTDGISTRNTTVMSAMAHGLPIVSYVPSPGNFEDKPIPYAALVPQGDTGAFIEKALHFAVKKTDDTKSLEQTAYYQSHFSWNSIAMKYLNLLKAQ